MKIERRVIVSVLPLLPLARPGEAAESADDARVALVIGNAAYAEPLPNPINDARSVGALLRAKGFTVIELHDATRSQLVAALSQARDRLKGKNGIGLFYYAGHGVQLDWRNYLIPVDATPRSADEVMTAAIDVQAVLGAFKAAGTRLNIVILDACRDNPFGEAASGKGLAQLDAPSGTFIAYATAPGNVSREFVGAGNSIYTKHLVAQLKEPADRIEDVFKRVRLNVRRETRGAQIPWESTSLEEDFSFEGIAAAKPRDRHLLLEAFEREKAEWERIRSSNDAADFYGFLDKHPQGYLSEQAQYRLDQLQRAQIEPAPGRDGLKVLPSGVRRYEPGDEFAYDVVDHDVAFGHRTGRERVTLADDRRVYFTSGTVMDQMGGLLRTNDGVEHEPADVEVPSTLAKRMKWRCSYVARFRDGRTEWRNVDAEVVDIEMIQTPAGAFSTYKIVRRGTVSSGGTASGYLQQEIWVDPTTMYRVRNHVRIWFGQRRSVDRTYTLVEIKRSPRKSTPQ